MKKGAKYILYMLGIGLIAYNSVYVQNLQVARASLAPEQFDAVSYTRVFWEEQLIPNLDKAVEIETLVSQLESQKEQAFDSYSHALGIGNLRYFLVRGQGEISEITENEVVVQVGSADYQGPVHIATEFVYGNAVRDALGLIKINDFNSTMALNNISEEINKKIRTDVVPPFRAKAREGVKVDFIGAIELNRKHLDLEKIELIPIQLKIVNN